MIDMSRCLLITNINIKNEDDKNKEGKKVYKDLFNNELNIKLWFELLFIHLKGNEKIAFANDSLNKFIYTKKL